MHPFIHILGWSALAVIVSGLCGLVIVRVLGWGRSEQDCDEDGGEE